MTRKAPRRNLDPSRTTFIRKQFEAELRRRFKRLRKEIFEELDPSYPGTSNKLFIVNARWNFPSAADALERFKRWLEDRMDILILEKTKDPGPEGTWLDRFIETVFFKGAEQAEAAVNKSKGGLLNKLTQGVTGFLRGPVNLDKVKLLKARAYEQLQGITSAMSTNIGNILADGITKGDSPRTVARKISKEIEAIEKKRARTMARTETMRAHSEGALEAFKQLGVTEVGVDVEWTTTKHLDGSFEARVCPLCRELEGMIIPIEKASGLLPRHPNCRCTWIPSFDEMSNKQRKQRIRNSIKAGMPKKKKRSFEDQVERDSWPGADLA